MEDGATYSFSSSAPPSVQVIETQRVGPYETVTLRADSSGALLGWLTDNGYDLPDAIEPLLVPYVAGEAYFVALRLANGFDTGDIAPLGFRYAGDRPQIPIQLTSVAASPDMRLEVYVLGPARAVPESYLHLQINEAAIDWTTGGSNYEDVVSLAANEAGGHGFATDYAGLAIDWAWILPSNYDLDALYAASGPVAWMDALIGAGVPSGDATLAVLMRQIPMPPEVAAMGVSDTDFYNCLGCYAEYLGGIDFDATVATNDLAINVTDPIEHAQDLFERHHWLSRMTSSLDAVEMTVDPVFVFNEDMGLVDLAHEADLTTVCSTGGSYYDAIRRVDLDDGRVVYYPSQQWLDENGLTVAEWLLQWNLNAASVIEQTAAEGEPTVLFDLSAEDDDALGELNDWVLDSMPVDATEAEGCGCDTSGSASGWLIGLGGLLAVRRRRS
jgi:MYXO-CTERM domain-containing protein